jgi:oligopeptide/dipeptide ABC transporter ATP-binding protein
MATYTQFNNTDATAEDVVLEVRNASVSFDMSRGESRVLRDVDLAVRHGETIGVVGESGSGKSMLASAMLDAVVSPGRVNGSVLFHPPDGESVDLLSVPDDELAALRWNEVSFVIQGAQSAFNPTMTIDAHFEETLRAHDRDVATGMEHGRELLKDLHLPVEQVLYSHPHELSGGMKQRALIALSLILNPTVLVMDEPTAALDLLMQRSIISLLADLKEKYDLTLVFVTHDLPLVADIADRLAVMYAFELVECGSTESVLSNPAHPYTRMLLNAVPDISNRTMELEGIQGSSPDPVNVPSGCSFNPRCPLADEECHEHDPDLETVTRHNPDLKTVDSDHRAACFHCEEAADAISLNQEETQ